MSYRLIQGDAQCKRELAAVKDQAAVLVDALLSSMPVEGELLDRNSPAIKNIRADFWGTHRALRELICAGCQHAVFHGCCGRFCRCRGSHEREADGIGGTCPYYRLPDAPAEEKA